MQYVGQFLLNALGFIKMPKVHKKHLDLDIKSDILFNLVLFFSFRGCFVLLQRKAVLKCKILDDI